MSTIRRCKTDDRLLIIIYIHVIMIFYMTYYVSGAHALLLVILLVNR